MTSRRWNVAAGLVAMAVGIALTVQVRAGADNVAFPENFAKGVKWLTVNRTKTKEVHEHFTTPAAVEAARKDQPMPSGTVFALARYAAQLDAQNNPIKGPDGFFLKGKLLGYGVMEKRTGWGRDYPEALRNGEWEYRVFMADKKPDTTKNLNACFECHKSQVSRDYIHAYDKLKQADR